MKCTSLGKASFLVCNILPVNLNCHCGHETLVGVLAKLDVMRDKADLNIRSLGFHLNMNDVNNGVMAKNGKGHNADETTSRGNVVGAWW
jgi:hypothetical protein